MNFSIKKLVAYLVVLVIACVSAVAGYIAYTKSKENVKTELFTIEEAVMVNLKKDSDGSKVLKAKLTLEYTGKKGAEIITAEMSRINDTIINVLSNKTNSEIIKDTDKVNLRKELVNKLNKTLKQEMIVNVLFNEFITS